MIMVGKVIVSLIWVFWIFVIDSTAEGNPSDPGVVVSEPITLSEEYNPTYSSTFDRVNKRGYIICGTNDEFPGFSQNSWNSEDGSKWVGFDVDICRAVAVAVFGHAEDIEFTVVNGKT